GKVVAGEIIAELADAELRLMAQRLLSQRAELTTRIDGIRQRAHTDDAALLDLAYTEEALAALNKQITRLQKDVAKLTIRAPEDGIIVPPPSRPPQERDRLQLASWSGRPLDVRNVGAF